MFSKLIGNEKVKLALKRLTKNARVPNSMLLCGDEGVGKRQFALEIARSFVCTELVDGEACGICAACRRTGKFTFPKPEERDEHKRVIFSEHPDVGMVIPHNRNILIDAIRHLESEANYRPYEAGARVFIVDDADKMNDPASNALLKTLEEPSSTAYIFLVTSRPDALLPTIRSRCQTIRFAPVPTDEIEKFLIEDRAFTHDEARLAARLSRGSIGRAISVNVVELKKRRETMLRVVANSIRGGRLADIMRAAEEMIDPKDPAAYEEHLNVLQSLIHDVWTVAITGEKGRIVNSDLADAICNLADSCMPSELPGWMSEIEELRENLGINVNKKIAADALFVSMAGA